MAGLVGKAALARVARTDPGVSAEPGVIATAAATPAAAVTVKGRRNQVDLMFARPQAF
jgi:hypothetical protein